LVPDIIITIFRHVLFWGIRFHLPRKIEVELPSPETGKISVDWLAIAAEAPADNFGQP
jgi:hypothetical protein